MKLQEERHFKPFWHKQWKENIKLLPPNVFCMTIFMQAPLSQYSCIFDAAGNTGLCKMAVAAADFSYWFC
jgi:hypothetical protein